MSNYEIHDRIFNFVVEVINFLNELPKTPTNSIIINQITRSVTSMGANDQEADGSLTTKDFIHCSTTVRKEGKETLFWLKLISKTNKNHLPKVSSLIVEAGEIVAVISTIIKKTSDNVKSKNSLVIGSI